jgi:hypothetical protein
VGYSKKPETFSPQNGALSAVPYICQAVSGFIAGQTADILRAKGILNTTNTRKLYQNLGISSENEMFLVCAILTAIHLSVAIMASRVDKFKVTEV